MTHLNSQTEAFDISLLDLDNNDMNTDMPVTDQKHFNDLIQKGWHAGYVSPYRAAFHRGAN